MTTTDAQNPTTRPDLLPKELPEALQTALKTRLRDLANALPIEHREAFENAIPPDFALGSDVQSSNPSFEIVSSAKRALRRNFERFPLSTSLAQMFEPWSEYRVAHDRLLAWLVFASLSLMKLGGEHQDAVARSLADCRLLAQIKSQNVLLRHFKSEILSIEDLIQALNRVKHDPNGTQITARHADSIRVVVEYFRNSSPAIIRERGSKSSHHYFSRSVQLKSDDAFQDDQPRMEEVVTAISEVEIQAWRDDDSGAGSTLIRATPTGDGREKRIAALQRDRSRGFVNALAIRRHRLPAHWDHLTPFELSEAVRITIERMTPGVHQNWRDYLGVALVIALGRAPHLVIEMLTPGPTSPQASKIVLGSDGRYLLEHETDIPLRKNIGANERQIINNAQVELVRISLPEFFQKPINALYPDSDDPIILPDTDAVIAELSVNLARPISLLRLSRALNDQVTINTQDSSVAGLIVGRSVKNLPCLYYTSHSILDIQRAYDEAIGQIFKISLTSASSSDAKVGTQNRYPRHAVQELYKVIRGQVKNARESLWPEQVEFHNLYTLFTYLLLLLATGHRPVRNAFESCKDFELNKGYVYIGDKHNRLGPNFRIVPLAPTVSRQVQYWMRHLGYLSQKWRIAQPMIAQAALDALEGAGKPSTFLFFIDRRADEDKSSEQYVPIALTPSNVRDRLQNIWPVKDNWTRHFLRTELSRKLPDEILDSFMGHDTIGAEPLIRESALALSDFQALRDAIETLLDDLDVGAAHGLQ